MATFNEYVEVEAEIEVTPQDIFDTCSEKECQKLADILFENGFYPTSGSSQNESYFAGSNSYTEQELAKSLAEIWRSRNLLNQSQLDRIHSITRESYV